RDLDVDGPYLFGNKSISEAGDEAVRTEKKACRRHGGVDERLPGLVAIDLHLRFEQIVESIAVDVEPDTPLGAREVTLVLESKGDVLVGESRRGFATGVVQTFGDRMNPALAAGIAVVVDSVD